MSHWHFLMHIHPVCKAVTKTEKMTAKTSYCSNLIILHSLFITFSGTKMLEHVLGICEKDGNYDNVFL